MHLGGENFGARQASPLLPGGGRPCPLGRGAALALSKKVREPWHLTQHRSRAESLQNEHGVATLQRKHLCSQRTFGPSTTSVGTSKHLEGVDFG